MILITVRIMRWIDQQVTREGNAFTVTPAYSVKETRVLEVPWGHPAYELARKNIWYPLEGEERDRLAFRLRPLLPPGSRPDPFILESCEI